MTPHTTPLPARRPTTAGSPTDAPNAVQVLRCTTPADILSALPRLLGFDPEDSLIVLRFSGTRSVEAARIDLPRVPGPESTAQVLGLLRSALQSLTESAARSGDPTPPRITGLGIAVVTSVRFGRSRVPPWTELAAHIATDCREAGIALTVSCCRAADGWADYRDADAVPVGGRPLAELAATPLALEAALRDSPVPTQAEYGSLPEPDPHRCALLATELTPDLATLRAASTSGSPAATPVPPASVPPQPPGLPVSAGRATPRQLPRAVPPELVPHVVEVASAFREARSLSVADTVRAVRVLADPGRWLGVVLGIMLRPVRAGAMLRDADTSAQLLAVLQPDPEHALAPYPRLLMLLSDVGAAFTERGRLAAVRDRVDQALAECPPPLSAPLAALSAWLWWLSGTQSVAQRRIDAAAERHADHALLRTVAALIAVPSHVSRFADPQPFSDHGSGADLGETPLGTEVPNAE